MGGSVTGAYRGGAGCLAGKGRKAGRRGGRRAHRVSCQLYEPETSDSALFRSIENAPSLLDYSVSMSNSIRQDGTVLTLRGKDRAGGLLSDVTFAMSSLELDIIAANISTDASTGIIEDVFVIEKNGCQIPHELFESVQDTVLLACAKSASLSYLRVPTKQVSDWNPSAALVSGQALAPVLPTEIAIEAEPEEEAIERRQEEAAPPSTGVKWTPAAIKAFGLVNVAAMLFGSNQVLIKMAETEVSPDVLNIARFGIAAIALLPLGLSSKIWKKPKLMWSALELGGYLFIGYTTQVLGLELTTASRGGVMMEFAVLVVPFLSRLSGKKIDKVVWWSAFAALVGVAMVTNSGDGGSFNLGDLLCILSATCFGIHVFRSEDKVEGLQEGDIRGLVAAQLAVLAVGSGIYGAGDYLLHNGMDFAAHPSASLGSALNYLHDLPWLNLMFMGLGTTAFTIWIEITALKDISSTLAALIYTTEPLWGATFAAVILHENFGALGYAGAALIVGSTCFATLKGNMAKDNTQLQTKTD